MTRRRFARLALLGLTVAATGSSTGCIEYVVYKSLQRPDSTTRFKADYYYESQSGGVLSRSVIGGLVSSDSTHVTLRPLSGIFSNSKPVTVPSTMLISFYRSEGRSHPRGAMFGAVAGLVVGGVVAAVSTRQCSGLGDFFCGVESGRDVAAALGILSAAGATWWGIIGVETWQRIPVPSVPSVAPVSPGTDRGIQRGKPR